MKISMMGFEFNRIMRVCIPALDKSGTRRALERIEIRCAGGVGTATAGDGFCLTQCRFTYDGDDGRFLLPRHRSVSNGARITITVKGDKISVSDDDETVTRKLYDDTHPAWARIVSSIEEKEQNASIILSASRLRRILNSFDNLDDAVSIEIRGGLDGVIMRAPGTFCMLMPIRADEQRHLARFIVPGEGEANA